LTRQGFLAFGQSGPVQDVIFQAGLDAFRVDLFGKLFVRRDESPRLSLKMTPSPRGVFPVRGPAY
jgi:hypothetical protein